MGRPKGSGNKKAKAILSEAKTSHDSLLQSTVNTIMIRLNTLVQRISVLESNISELASNQSNYQDCTAKNFDNVKTCLDELCKLSDVSNGKDAQEQVN